MIEDERSSAFNEDVYVGELQAECRRLRRQVADLAAKLLMEGSNSQHAFDVIEMRTGKQVHLNIRDVYYPNPADPLGRVRIIVG